MIRFAGASLKYFYLETANVLSTKCPPTVASWPDRCARLAFSLGV